MPSLARPGQHPATALGPPSRRLGSLAIGTVTSRHAGSRRSWHACALMLSRAMRVGAGSEEALRLRRACQRTLRTKEDYMNALTKPHGSCRGPSGSDMHMQTKEN